MKKTNSFQKVKVQPKGAAWLLLKFFTNFGLPLLIKVLLIKKRIFKIIDHGSKCHQTKCKLLRTN